MTHLPEFSRNRLTEDLTKIESKEWKSEFNYMIVKDISSIIVKVKFDWKLYSCVVVSNFKGLNQDEVDFLVWEKYITNYIREKGKFIDRSSEAISKIRKRLVEMWYKTNEELELTLDDLDDIFPDEKESEENVDNSFEKLEKEISAWEERKKKEEEEKLMLNKLKMSLLGDLGLDYFDVQSDKLELGELTVSLKSCLRFPLREQMILNIKPEIYIPYLYRIHLEDIYEDWKVSFVMKWLVWDGTLKKLLRKLVEQKIVKVRELNGAEYNIQDHLVKVLKNPYFGLKLSESVRKVLQKQDTCMYCQSSGFVQINYSKITTMIEVGMMQQTKTIEPFKYSSIWWNIESVVCGNCKRSLTAVEDYGNNKWRQKEMSDFYSDFACSNCGENAFHDVTKRSVLKVELENALVEKSFSAFKQNIEEGSRLIKSGEMVKIYCQNPACKEKWATYK